MDSGEEVIHKGQREAEGLRQEDVSEIAEEQRK